MQNQLAPAFAVAPGSASDEATDYGRDAIARGDRDQLDRCAYCAKLYDPAAEGHTDEASELSFCDAPCEMHYAQETGLPKCYAVGG
jgi:hypothetical protein